MNTFDGFTKLYSDFLSPILDLVVLTFILYKAYQLLIKTNAIQLIRAAITIAIIYVAAFILKLNTLLWILNMAAPGLLVCFAIVFQPELRKVFLKLGQNQWFSFGKRATHTHIDSVLTAADLLSKQKRGMLVVFQRHTKLDDLLKGGQMVNADLSCNLLVTIFLHDTPMHDGACIVQGGKLIAAGCFLPLSEQYDIKKTFGTRHRAALGLSESTDAVVLVVSEETGAISLAYDSRLFYDMTLEQLSKTLTKQLGIKSTDMVIED